MQKVNLIKVKKMGTVLTGLRNGAMFKNGKFNVTGKYKRDIKGLDETPHLFYYTVYTFIDKENYSTISEDQAGAKLELADIEVYFCKMTGSNSKAPKTLQGVKDLHTETIVDHKELSDLIFTKTGVRVAETELQTKQMQAWNKKSLKDKINILMKKPIRLFSRYSEEMENAKKNKS